MTGPERKSAWPAAAVLAVLTATVVAAPATASPDGTSAGREAPSATRPTSAPSGVEIELPGLGGPGAGGALKWLALITLLSVAPAVAVLVTSFTRIIVVLGLLRQALGTAQTPPNQVLFGLALLMTVAVMSPVGLEVHREAIGPYLAGERSAPQALAAAERPVRAFMIRQIDAAGNDADVRPFLPKELRGRWSEMTWGDVPTLSLLPGFVISELKVAFTIGFRIFLPFLIVDLLVASVLTSMGMLMLPPVLISLPFKLLLFVLADGWHLVVETLMAGFA